MLRRLLFLLLGLQMSISYVAADTPRFSCSVAKPSHDIDASVPGEIVSPGYPGTYSSNQDCIWKLKAPLASLVRIKITNLNLDQSDFLTISDGETAFLGNLIGKYSQCLAGSLSLFSTGQYMLIQFNSDNALNDKGFKIEYKTVRKGQLEYAGRVNTVCSFNVIVKDSSGYIAHPGFPGPVTQFKGCFWQVRYTTSNRPHISFKMLGLKADPGKCYESQVRYKILGKDFDPACGCAGLPDNQKSMDNNAYFQFKARPESGTGQPGFLVYYKDIDQGKCPDATNCPDLNDDRDVGFDRNAYILYEKKVVTTTPAPTPPPTEKPIKPFDVKCDQNTMEIVLNTSKFGDFQTDTATLMDTSCKARRFNSTHVYMSTPLDGCDTFHNYSSDGRYVIYHNQIKLQKKTSGGGGNGLITRDHEAVFQFECRYYRRMVMSVVHFNPARAIVYTTTENFGNFTFMMRMFKSDEYKEAYDKYPVYIWASKKVYIQTEVKAKDAELVLLVEKCHVTPSKNRNDKEFYDLIEEGCSKDETLEYKHKLEAIQRFHFKAFYFTVDKKATVHIHCKVRVCRKADKNSRCVKGCPYSRRRRATSEDNSENEFTGSLSLGPLTFQEQGQTGRSTSSDTRPKMFIEIVVGVLGFFVVILLVAVSVVIWKKRQQSTRKHLSLIVDDREQ